MAFDFPTKSIDGVRMHSGAPFMSGAMAWAWNMVSKMIQLSTTVGLNFKIYLLKDVNATNTIRHIFARANFTTFFQLSGLKKKINEIKIIH